MRITLLAALAAVSAAAVPDVPLYKVKGAPIDQRVADLVSRMTLEEKVNQLIQVWFTVTYDQIIALYNQTSVGAAYLMYLPNNGDNRTQWQAANDLQRYMLKNSRLGIPVDMVQETLHGGMQNGTIFPMPCSMGATWNVSLVHAIGRIIGVEARVGGATRAFSPELQVDTDPRFGRLQEGFGEDPKLVSDLGVAYALGMLNDNTGGPNAYLDVTAPVTEAKHYAAYGFAGKDGYRADMSNATLFNVYLRPWRAYARATGARAIMLSHQETNGLPNHMNTWLVRDVFRGMFGGNSTLVGSDYGDINNLRLFQMAVTQEDAALLALQAGVDQELGGSTYPTLVTAGSDGRLNVSDLDRAVSNALRGKFATGLFDGADQVNITALMQTLDAPPHRALAYEAAVQGSVLLQNNGMLPLDLGGAVRRVALIGPNAGCEQPPAAGSMCDAQWNQIGGYSAVGATVVTLRDAFEAAANASGGAWTVSYARGANIDDDNGSFVDAAVALAAASDVVVLALGDSLNSCGEGIDVDSLDWNAGQMRLLQALVGGTQSRTPVALVAVHGRPFTLGAGPLAFTGPYNAILSNISALVAAWRPGEAGGNALFALLSGAENFSGRLAQAWPRAAGAVRGPANPYLQAFGVGLGDYADESVSPLWPFGFGLSYNSANITNVTVAGVDAPVAPNATLDVTVTLANAGPAGVATVQVYITQAAPTRVVRFAQALLAFARVPLAANATGTTAVISCDVADAAWYDVNVGDYVVYSGTYLLSVGLNSADAGNAVPIAFNVTGGF